MSGWRINRQRTFTTKLVCSVPVMKATEVRLFVAIVAKHQLNLFKSDCKQAFLNCDMEDEKIYICQPDW